MDLSHLTLRMNYIRRVCKEAAMAQRTCKGLLQLMSAV